LEEFAVARRGFFAELHYQNQLAEKRRLQAERTAARAYAAAVRQEEQAQRRAEQAAAQFARATAAEQKAAEREAKRLHQEARLAEVSSLNARLEETFDEIDSLLAATLDVDDFVDLERLRVTVEHPPFARSDLEVPTPPPTLASAPAEPVFAEPEAPKGIGGLFGKKKHAEAVAAAQATFEKAHQEWQVEAGAIPDRQLQQRQDHDAAERNRLEALQQARDEYRQECDERETEAAKRNGALDDLIVGLQTGKDSAIQEYVGIVLGNSVYPEAFPVEYDFEFDSELKELELTALVPPPSALPSTREYRYVKAKDEITETALPKRELKDRYGRAVYQVALRTLHEVFEADRAGRIQTIALTVATDAIDPATGRNKRTNLAAVGADRTSFMTFDLHNIVPEATLQHLGASLSKSPYDLVSIDATRGVRGR
jgi:restriction system protein